MSLASDRKTQIILSAIECISRYGYSNFSMQDLARLADVSKGVIHYYFLNKEALMMAVLDYVCQDVQKLLEGTEHILDPLKRLSHTIWICANIIKTKRRYYKINMDFWTQIDQKDHVKKVLADHYSNFRNAIANIIKAGIDEGLLQDGDTQFLASIILAIIDGIAVQCLFEEPSRDYDELIKSTEEVIMKLLKPPVSIS